MKSRLIILPLVVCFLMVSGTLSAQEKPPAQKKKPMMMMQSKGMGMQEGMGMGMHTIMEKAWHMGATSMVLSDMLDEAGEILAGGNLKPEDQKALAEVLDQLGDLVPQLFYPGGMKEERVQEIKKTMDELSGKLEKLEAQSKKK